MQEIFGKYPLGSSSGTIHGSGNGLLHSSEKNNASGSHYFVNEDDFGADLFLGENEYMDMFHDDHLYNDHYAIVQAHFDSLDIPPGVEVSVPWFMDHEENKMKSAVASTSTHSTSPIELDAVGFPPCSDSSSSTKPLEFEQLNDKLTLGGGSSLGAKLKAMRYPRKCETSSSWIYEDLAQVRKRSVAASTTINMPSEFLTDFMDFPSKMELPKHRCPSAESWRSKTKRNLRFTDHVSSPTKPLDKGASTELDSSVGTKLHGIVQPGAVGRKLVLQDIPRKTKLHSYPSAAYASGFVDPSGPLFFFTDDMTSGPWDKDPLKGQKSATAPGNSSESFCGKGKYGEPNDFLKNFDKFKRFDTVQDYADHHFHGHGSSMKQVSFS